MKPNAQRKNQVHRDITSRDTSIMKYLWKWKLVSTAALSAKFFPNLSLQTAYRRLLKLAEAGYLQYSHINDASGDGWCLTPKCYKYVRHLLGDLRTEGFKSEYPHHDGLVAAFHLGDWLTNQPDYTQTFTEQQLRRIPVDLWDDWVPKSETHRPDGYSLMFKGEEPLVFAFEVELWLKSKSRYEPLVAFYDVQRSIHAVFWLVNSRVILNSLERTFKSFNIRDLAKHNFVVLEDFRRHGWAAPIVAGKYQGRSLADILLHLPPAKPPLRSLHGGSLALLNNSKKPVFPKSYAKPQKS